MIPNPDVMTQQQYDQIVGVYRLLYDVYRDLVEDGEPGRIAMAHAQLSRLATILNAYSEAHPEEYLRGWASSRPKVM